MPTHGKRDTGEAVRTHIGKGKGERMEVGESGKDGCQ